MGRANAVAILLQTGKVLVMGGEGEQGILASAELYQLETGAWLSAGSMQVSRRALSATVLQNGKVLVAGGSVVTTTELYDPTMGMWSSTGSMLTPRSGHSATLLENGQVLVAGPTTTAELYDPTRGVWRATGSMLVERGLGSRGVLLQDGRVLVVGGAVEQEFPGGGAPSTIGLSSAELYQLGTGTWSATASMSSRRSGPAAVRLADGRVLVAGGTSSISPRFGSTCNFSAELYDPVTGTWTATRDLPQCPAAPAILLPDGRVFVASGYLPDSVGTLSPSMLYDPATGIWSSVQGLREGRYGAGGPSFAPLPDGGVLATGGRNPTNGSYLASAERFVLQPYRTYFPVLLSGTIAAP